MSIRRFAFGLTAVLLLLAVQARAALIAPGQTMAVPVEPDPTGGVVVAGGVPVPFISPPGPGQFSGTLTTTVISGDPSNPFGGLTFVYQLANNTSSQAGIGRMTNINFTGFNTDVSAQPATGQIPDGVDRSIGSGAVIGWTWSTPPGAGLAPGQTSARLVVQTNAPAFQPVPANIIDGSTVQAASFGPLVPEPATAGVLTIGLGAMLIRRRSRA